MTLTSSRWWQWLPDCLHKTHSHQKSSVDSHHNILLEPLAEMYGPIFECDKIINIWSTKLVKVFFCSYLWVETFYGIKNVYKPSISSIFKHNLHTINVKVHRKLFRPIPHILFISRVLISLLVLYSVYEIKDSLQLASSNSIVFI